MNDATMLVMSLPMWTVFWLSAQDAGSRPGSETDGRLVIEREDQEVRSIEFRGVVQTRNKYSIVVESEQGNYLVRVSGNTRFILKLASPRFFFNEGQLVIRTTDDRKTFRSYKFPSPLYLQTQFAHRKQYQRVMAMAVKRLSGYELGGRFPDPPGTGEDLRLTGKLSAGRSNRELKLETSNGTYEVMLAKRGLLTGRSIADLSEETTAVEVRGQINGGDVEASEIFFWPISGTADRSGEDGSKNR